MTPTEAAEIIGCSPSQVRTLCRNKIIKSKRIKFPGGYYYQIQNREAIRYRNLPQNVGFPRGQKRNSEGKLIRRRKRRNKNATNKS